MDRSDRGESTPGAAVSNIFLVEHSAFLGSTPTPCFLVLQFTLRCGVGGVLLKCCGIAVGNFISLIITAYYRKVFKLFSFLCFATKHQFCGIALSRWNSERVYRLMVVVLGGAVETPRVSSGIS